MRLYLTLLIFVLAACDRSIDGSLPTDSDILGSWLLYERGYSPGSGYITEPVPPSPAQTITFADNEHFESTITGLEVYTFYLIERDSLEQINKIKLFKERPTSAPGPENTNAVFFVEQSGQNFKLMQIGCIEGCHLGFKRPMGRE